ncbi:hypothetical protein CUC53_01695 [Aeromonas cavernicola]|uniref:Uncharacterized protein n=1 Tax=Aeromonas cavernicola TaxID=1006623 RepID=A0A2H9U8V7_9GAMM|nr:hypothetical protein CUC53_01695 [Aeromonas cavernicola]
MVVITGVTCKEIIIGLESSLPPEESPPQAASIMPSNEINKSLISLINKVFRGLKLINRRFLTLTISESGHPVRLFRQIILFISMTTQFTIDGRWMNSNLFPWSRRQVLSQGQIMSEPCLLSPMTERCTYYLN